MTIVVEDGTGLANANSYASVIFADGYFAGRGNTQWSSLILADKETSLIKATDYIDLWFSDRFKGCMKTEGQALAFPRINTGLLTEMPMQLLRAACEYAVRASVAPLSSDVEVDENGQMILKKVERVGPIEEETTFHSPQQISFVGKRMPIPAADGLMKFLLRSGGGVIRN